jgi:hypothetical protein
VRRLEVLALLVVCSSILLVLLVTYLAIKVIRPAEFTFRASFLRVFSLSLNMRLPEAGKSTPSSESEASSELEDDVGRRTPE